MKKLLLSGLLLVSYFILHAQDTLLRKPYMQLITPNSAIVHWRSLLPSTSTVFYGTNSNNLDKSASSPIPGIEHTIKIENLQPSTKYYYAIKPLTGTLKNDTNCYFITFPVKGQAQPTRIWAIGDAGNQNDQHKEVRDAFYKFNNNKNPDVWLMLGDNAYTTGMDQEYQKGLFDMYPEFAKHNAFFPAFGNHDSYSTLPAPGAEVGAFFQNFDLPSKGEYGNEASGTETYYSFDYANIHFIALDANISQRLLRGKAMLDWLIKDLQQNTQKWTIAFWHHPPYTKGSHDSDNSTADFELPYVREMIVPILEEYGIDLVLNGHSHSYERSKFLNGHYGFSSTLSDSMIVQQGDGKAGGDGPYLKYKGPNKGVVYVVAGSTSYNSGGDLNHPAMQTSLQSPGSFILDIDGDDLTGKFLDEHGVIRDEFTIRKMNDITTTTQYLNNKITGKLFPNPATNETTLSFSLTEPCKLILSVINISGKEILHRRLGKVMAGEQMISQSTHRLENGIYSVRLFTEDGKQLLSKRLIVLK